MMRPVLRLALAMIAATLLSSCWWVGPPLYTGDPADAGPVKPGVYKVDVLGDGHPGRTYRIAWQPDGTIRVTPLRPKKDEGPSSTVMVRFSASGRDLWIVQEVAEEGQTDVSYGLAELHGDVLWALPIIDCDTTADLVRAAGGTVSGGSEVVSNVAVADDVAPEMAATPAPSSSPASERTNQSCEFADRASLERALRAYVASNPAFSLHIRLKRIGD